MNCRALILNINLYTVQISLFHRLMKILVIELSVVRAGFAVRVRETESQVLPGRCWIPDEIRSVSSILYAGKQSKCHTDVTSQTKVTVVIIMFSSTCCCYCLAHAAFVADQYSLHVPSLQIALKDPKSSTSADGTTGSNTGAQRTNTIH